MITLLEKKYLQQSRVHRNLASFQEWPQVPFILSSRVKSEVRNRRFVWRVIMSDSSLRRSVNDGSHSFTCHAATANNSDTTKVVKNSPHWVRQFPILHFPFRQIPVRLGPSFCCRVFSGLVCSPAPITASGGARARRSAPESTFSRLRIVRLSMRSVSCFVFSRRRAGSNNHQVATTPDCKSTRDR